MGSSRKSILIIDDDRVLCESVEAYFESDEWRILAAQTAEHGLDVIRKNQVDIVILDQKLPDAEGHTLCQPILKHKDRMKIIFITAFPSFENALKAIRAGAYDYLSKPFEMEQLQIAIERAFRTLELEMVEEFQEYRVRRDTEWVTLIGVSLHEVRKMVESFAPLTSPVLVTGETGTGKNVVAKAIHYGSGARRDAFISINCAALPENLIESEIFGYEKGAFTDAVATRKGVFEMAEGGTLVLDEIGEMPVHLQAKLLSVIEEKKVRRLGGRSEREIDVRIIATTNRDLEDAVERGIFRRDLFYRLNVMRVHVPPLRERKEDIPDLCEFFMEKLGRGKDVKIPEREMSLLLRYDWPGNVRELRNVLERSLILRTGVELHVADVIGSSPPVVQTPAVSGESTENKALRDVERNHIIRMYESNGRNLARTAQDLEISLSTLKRKLRDYGLR